MLLTPRIRMMVPAPISPPVSMMRTPATCLLIMSVMSAAGATVSRSIASILATTLPRVLVSCSPAVPVTTMASSGIADSTSAIRRAVLPTGTVWVREPYPIRVTSRITSTPGTFSNRKRPSSSVTCTRLVPDTITRAPSSGWRERASITVPATTRCWAPSGTAPMKSRRRPAHSPPKPLLQPDIASDRTVIQASLHIGHLRRTVGAHEAHPRAGSPWWIIVIRVHRPEHTA